MSLSRVSTILPAEFGEENPTPSIDQIEFCDPELLEYLDEGAGGKVYRDGKGSVIKVFHPASHYPAEDPQALLRERFEEMRIASELGQLGLAPEFRGEIVTPDGRRGFKMQEANGGQLVDQTRAQRELYRARVSNMAENLIACGYGSLGDLEIMLHNDREYFGDPDQVMLFLVDLTSLYRLSSDREQRNAQIDETRRNLLYLVDQPHHLS